MQRSLPLIGSLLLYILATLGCTPPPSAPAQDEAKTTPEPPTADEQRPADTVVAEANLRPLGTAQAGDRDFIKAEPGPPLTDEEKALIAADVSTLSKEQQRARAHAVRKRIMLDPTSPQAQMILRGAKDILEGTIQGPNASPAEGQPGEPAHNAGGLVLTPPPHKPAKGDDDKQ